MTTKERVERAWPILEAAKAGKEIQYNVSHGTWESGRDGVGEPTLEFIFTNPDRYRVKPEPRDWWIIDDGSTAPFRYKSLRDAHEENILSGNTFPIIHVREVIE
jgi:hypothetical protein